MRRPNGPLPRPISFICFKEKILGKNFCIAAISACIVMLQAVSMAHAAESLTLFGSPLKNATRTELRAAIAKAGLSPKRVDDGYFCDEYGVHGQLSDASALAVCYTEDNNRFAAATYTFPAFVDASKVKQVIQMVNGKYGRPSAVQGMYELGNVKADWYRPGGMLIEVTRGWPDTTVFLTLEDRNAYAKMQAQMKKEQAHQAQQQLKHDSSAF